MAANKKPGLLEQDRAETKETMPSIAENESAVKGNELRALRIAAGVSAREIVELVQKFYPKYDKTLQSKCENSADYGVCLVEDAMDALRERFLPDAPKGAAPSKDRHIYTTKVQCRLPDTQAERLKELLYNEGLTVQDWLAGIIAAYLKKHERSENA